MPKVKKKRMSFVIDMTPLVDITFLLLTFLMFTAQFKSETENKQTFQIERPEASVDTTHLPETDLAIVNIDITDGNKKDTAVYYGVTNAKDRADMLLKVQSNFKNVKGILKISDAEIKKLEEFRDSALVRVDTALLGKMLVLTMLANKKTVFAIDADKDVNFRSVFTIMDIMRRKQANKFHYVTQKRRAGE